MILQYRLHLFLNNGTQKRLELLNSSQPNHGCVELKEIVYTLSRKLFQEIWCSIDLKKFA